MTVQCRVLLPTRWPLPVSLLAAILLGVVGPGLLLATDDRPVSAASAKIEAQFGIQEEPRKVILLGDQLKVGRILFLGNSITLHGPAPSIGWNGNWGMAASVQEKDYVHLLLERIALATGTRPKAKITNIADFERQLGAYKLEQGLQQELEFEADVVLVAIGENVAPLSTDAAKDEFRTAFSKLLVELKKRGQPVIFVRSSFWADAAKDDIMQQCSKDADVVFIDIGPLGRDESNFARSERKFEHAGVAGHPGDKGMAAIAGEFWKAIRKQAALPEE